MRIVFLICPQEEDGFDGEDVGEGELLSIIIVILEMRWKQNIKNKSVTIGIRNHTLVTVLTDLV